MLTIILGKVIKSYKRSLPAILTETHKTGGLLLTPTQTHLCHTAASECPELDVVVEMPHGERPRRTEKQHVVVCQSHPHHPVHRHHQTEGSQSTVSQNKTYLEIVFFEGKNNIDRTRLLKNVTDLNLNQGPLDLDRLSIEL